MFDLEQFSCQLVAGDRLRVSRAVCKCVSERLREHWAMCDGKSVELYHFLFPVRDFLFEGVGIMQLMTCFWNFFNNMNSFDLLIGKA